MTDSSTTNLHEEAFVRAFICGRTKPRMLELLKKPRRRDSFLELLNGADLNDGVQHATVIKYSKLEKGCHFEDIIHSRLKKLGAPRECYVFSMLDSLDGTHMQLIDAIYEAFWCDLGTVVSCIPGHLAYWTMEGPSDEILCHK